MNKNEMSARTAVENSTIDEANNVNPQLQQCNVVCSGFSQIKNLNMLEKTVEIKVIHSQIKMHLNQLKNLKQLVREIEDEIETITKSIEIKLEKSFKLSIEVDDISTEFLIKNNK